jgi:hypothetical protein
MPANTDLFDDVFARVVEADGLVDQRRVDARRGKVHEDARRVGEAFVVEGHFGIELDHDTHGVGKRYPSDRFDRDKLGRRGIAGVDSRPLAARLRPVRRLRSPRSFVDGSVLAPGSACGLAVSCILRP